MTKDEGKKKRTKPRKEVERLKHKFEKDKPGPKEKLKKPKGVSLDEFIETSQEAMEKMEELKLSLNVEELMPAEAQDKVRAILEEGCAIEDANAGKKLMKKDKKGHHYHMNNPNPYTEGFEKHDVFNDDGSVKINNVIFLGLGNCLNDFDNVRVAPHPTHSHKYSIYVKGPRSA